MLLSMIPRATYRLQFNQHFTFKDATKIVGYLAHLGISHCYASPLLTAKPGSTHGYDVIDYNQLNSEIGTEEDFEIFINTLHENGMKLIVDIVPNHMFINHIHNVWWYDILENGPSSPFAEYFDIDWHPPRKVFDNKVLLPLLDQQYGASLENQFLKVTFQQNAFQILSSTFTLPTDPKSWEQILTPIALELEKILPEESPALIELHSIMTAIDHLPMFTESENEKKLERLREKEVIKKRLGLLMATHQEMKTSLLHYLDHLNGQKGDPLSFNLLELFLNAQPYRLCFWRVANDEINYRRFFDIVEYAGIRTENPAVFEAIHVWIKKCIQKKWIAGLRVDHIDGLWDPEEYLIKIKEQFNSQDNLYVIVEKILTGHEKLRNQWPVQGTVGYDFLKRVDELFVYSPNKNRVLWTYNRFIQTETHVPNLIYECKKIALNSLLSSELHVLARHLDRIAESHRSSQDFTSESLKHALSEIIAYFPVYRSYIRTSIGSIQEEDRQYVIKAINSAKRRNPTINASIYHFIQSVLLQEYPDELSDHLKIDRKNFVMRFQQLTGPTMAKGVEDTAFYRYYPLISLNEVGGDLATFGISPEVFHQRTLEQLEFWPHSLLATSTHDTKRSEDVRARIHVLSEIPDEWEKALFRWNTMNTQYKFSEDEEYIPDANEEYLLYQILMGTWPLESLETGCDAVYVKRIQQYMEKAIKEAKVHSSWMNPHTLYDQRISLFISKILDKETNEAFIQDLTAFIKKWVPYGLLNSLSQTIIKLTSPGIPDIYQGNEIWNFSLVDPDNRGPVNYENRVDLLRLISNEKSWKNCFQNPMNGSLKLYLIEKILNARKLFPEIFNQGIYVPLNVTGPMKNYIIAFARVFDNQCFITLTTRFFTFFMEDFSHYKTSDLWKNTYVELPVQMNSLSFYHLLSEQTIVSSAQSSLDMHEAFLYMPFAILTNCNLK